MKPGSMNQSWSIWNKNKPGNKPKPAGNVAGSASNAVVFSPQQLEQLMQLLPSLSKQLSKASKTDDKLDSHFSGMMSYHNSLNNDLGWIIDSGASDHMTPHFQKLIMPTLVTNLTPNIKLPTGDTVAITHM